MKSVVAPYETAVRCLRIECRNGTVIRLTRYPFDLTMSNATVYLSAAGADFSTSVAETTFAASSFDLEGFVGLAGIGRDDVASGVFDGATCKLFKTSFLAPVEDEEPMDRATLGRTVLEDSGYRIEMMGLVDLLSQSVVASVSPMCAAGSNFRASNSASASGPSALAICTAKVPTPPDAPLINTFCPGCTLPTLIECR